MNEITKPLYVYDEVKFKGEPYNFLACRIPIIENRHPFLRFIKTFPELGKENNIIKTKNHDYFKYYFQVYLDKVRETENVTMGDWIVIHIEHNKYSIVHTLTHKEFLNMYIVKDEDFLFEQGIVLNHKFFKLGNQVPITTWRYYPDNDVDLLIYRVRKNGGQIEYHNTNTSRRLRIHNERFFTEKRKSLKNEQPFQLVYPGDWVVVDYGNNTLIYENSKFLEVINKENYEDKAIL